MPGGASDLILLALDVARIFQIGLELLPYGIGEFRADVDGEGGAGVFGALEPPFEWQGVDAKFAKAGTQLGELVFFRFEARGAFALDESEFDSLAGEAKVGVVLPQKETVFGSAGEHPVGLGRATRHEVVEHHADIGLMPGNGERWLAQALQSGVRASDESLRGGLLVAGGAIDLAGKIEARQALRLESCVELGGWAVVVFHRISGTEDFGILEAAHAADEGVLHLEWQARGDAIHINLVGVASLGFQEKLVLRLFGKFDDFVLNARAVARADSFDFSGVEGGFVEIRADDFVGRFVGIGDPAIDLAGVEFPVAPFVECVDIVLAAPDRIRDVAEKRGRGVAWLTLALGKIDALREKAARGSCLEARHLEAEFAQAIAEGRDGITETATSLVSQADMQ